MARPKDDNRGVLAEKYLSRAPDTTLRRTALIVQAPYEVCRVRLIKVDRMPGSVPALVPDASFGA